MSVAISISKLSQISLIQRETFGKVGFVEMPQIPDRHVLSGLEAYRSRMARLTTIARGQFAVGVIFFHKRLAGAVAEECPFAAQSLGNECTRGAMRYINVVGWKLHHFLIPQGPRRHDRPWHGRRQGGDFGIGGFALESAGAAGGQNGFGSPDDFKAGIGDDGATTPRQRPSGQVSKSIV
jgi:hypothetical protein